MNQLQQLWNKLDGGKTYLGLFLSVVYGGLVYNNLIERSEVIENILLTITGLGLGDKARKAME